MSLTARSHWSPPAKTFPISNHSQNIDARSLWRESRTDEIGELLRVDAVAEEVVIEVEAAIAGIRDRNIGGNQVRQIGRLENRQGHEKAVLAELVGPYLVIARLVCGIRDELRFQLRRVDHGLPWWYRNNVVRRLEGNVVNLCLHLLRRPLGHRRPGKWRNRLLDAFCCICRGVTGRICEPRQHTAHYGLLYSGRTVMK